jgi:PAS domain S-box-containing protein
LLNNIYHRLLNRQIKNNLSEELIENPQVQEFLKVINKAYSDFDEDKHILENILENTNNELFKANNKLKEQIVSKDEQIIQQGILLNEVKTASDRDSFNNNIILDSIQEIILNATEAGIITFSSGNVQELLGYSKEEMIGQQFSEIVYNITREQLCEIIIHSPTEVDVNRKKLFQIQLKSKSGDLLDFEMTYSNQLNNPLLNCLIFTLRDISEQKKIIQANEKQRLFFKLVFDNIPTDVAVFNSDHRYIYVNKSALSDPKLREYIIGKDDFEYAKYMGRDTAGAQLRREKFNVAKTTKVQISWNENTLDKKGNMRHIVRAFHPVMDEKDQLEIMIGYALDITQIKNSQERIIKNEEKINLIMESALDAIAIIDETGNITFANQSAEKIFGWTREELLNSKLEDLLIPMRHNQIQNNSFYMLAGGDLSGSTNKVLEVNTVKKDGSEIVVELTIIPIKQDDKQFYCSFMRDITERKKHELEMIDINANLEEKIQERTNLLESTIKELDAFSYSVSHDLRSPLRGIDGWSLALLEDYGDKLDETAHEYLNRVRKETQRMGALIDDLLKLSKIGKSKIEMKPVNLSKFVQEIFERTREVSPYKADIELTIEPNIEIEADKNLLDALLTNLLSNAIKFTSKKEHPIIEIGTLKSGNKNFYIKDNGAGFNMNNASKLFGAFQRMHKYSDFEGTGIGLATVQRIVNLHGWKISAESKVNEGTTFYLELALNY